MAKFSERRTKTQYSRVLLLQVGSNDILMPYIIGPIYEADCLLYGSCRCRWMKRLHFQLNTCMIRNYKPQFTCGDYMWKCIIVSIGLKKHPHVYTVEVQELSNEIENINRFKWMIKYAKWVGELHLHWNDWMFSSFMRSKHWESKRFRGYQQKRLPTTEGNCVLYASTIVLSVGIMDILRKDTMT